MILLNVLLESYSKYFPCIECMSAHHSSELEVAAKTGLRSRQLIRVWSECWIWWMYRLIDLSPAFTRGHVSSHHNREAAAKLIWPMGGRWISNWPIIVMSGLPWRVTWHLRVFINLLLSLNTKLFMTSRKIVPGRRGFIIQTTRTMLGPSYHVIIL